MRRLSTVLLPLALLSIAAMTGSSDATTDANSRSGETPLVVHDSYPTFLRLVPRDAAVVRPQQTEPSCTVMDSMRLEATRVDGAIVFGVWFYGTKVECTQNIDDMSLLLKLFQNGTEVNEAEKPFQERPRASDELDSQHVCPRCNGEWKGRFGQVLEAPMGLVWAETPGCTLIDPRFITRIQELTLRVE